MPPEVVRVAAVSILAPTLMTAWMVTAVSLGMSEVMALALLGLTVGVSLLAAGLMVAAGRRRPKPPLGYDPFLEHVGPPTLAQALTAEDDQYRDEAARDLADAGWWLREGCPHTAALLATVAAYTVATPGRAGWVWEPHEAAVLARDDMTVEQMARLLRRTPAEVHERRHRQASTPQLNVPHAGLPTMGAKECRTYARALADETDAILSRPGRGELTAAEADRIRVLAEELGRVRRRLARVEALTAAAPPAAPPPPVTHSGDPGACDDECHPVVDPGSGEFLGRVHTVTATTLDGTSRQIGAGACPRTARTSAPCPLGCGGTFTRATTTGGPWTGPAAHTVVAGGCASVCPGRGTVRTDDPSGRLVVVSRTGDRPLILGPGVEYTKIGPGAIAYMNAAQLVMQTEAERRAASDRQERMRALREHAEQVSAAVAKLAALPHPRPRAVQTQIAQMLEVLERLAEQVPVVAGPAHYAAYLRLRRQGMSKVDAAEAALHTADPSRN